MNENDELLEQFEKKFEHEGASQKIEISLDKGKYPFLSRRVDEDGEIYLEKIKPSAELLTPPAVARNKRFYIKKSNKPVNTPARTPANSLADMPAVDDNGVFAEKLLAEEKLLWYAKTEYSRRSLMQTFAVSSALLFVISLLVIAGKSTNIGGALFCTIIFAAVITGLFWLYSEFNYAVTNFRVLIKAQAGREFPIEDIPLSRISDIKVKRFGNNHADIILLVKKDSETVKKTLVNIENPDRVIKLLRKLKRNIEEHDNNAGD